MTRSVNSVLDFNISLWGFQFFTVVDCTSAHNKLIIEEKHVFQYYNPSD